MNKEMEKQDRPVEDLQQIPTWTRRYAQTRMFPMLAGIGICLLLFLGIAGSSLFCGMAYRSGHFVLLGFSLVVLGILLVVLVFFSVPRWGGKFIQNLSQKYYRSEGTVTLGSPEGAKKKRRIGLLVALLFGICILTTVEFGMRGYFPIKYQQPISAIYTVPFLVFLYFWQRPLVNPLILLWPVLYSIHAILIVTGVPILFTGHYEGLNMFIPTFGYGFLSGLIGHLYNRYALGKLKKLAGGLNGEESHAGT